MGSIKTGALSSDEIHTLTSVVTLINEDLSILGGDNWTNRDSFDCTIENESRDFILYAPPSRNDRRKKKVFGDFNNALNYLYGIRAMTGYMKKGDVRCARRV